MSQRRLANLLATRPVLLVAVISIIGMVRRLINPRFAVPAPKRGNAETDGRVAQYTGVKDATQFRLKSVRIVSVADEAAELK
jgi:hypothetical protein